MKMKGCLSLVVVMFLVVSVFAVGIGSTGGEEKSISSEDIDSQTASFGGGSGTEEDPYLIEDWYHLDNVREELDAHYELVSDLDSDTAGYDELAGPDANELIDRGDWEEGVEYEKNDYVFYEEDEEWGDEGYFYCVKTHTSNETNAPDFHEFTEYWVPTENLESGDFLGWDPIGIHFPLDEERSDEFSGNFDGNDHTISELYINRGDIYVGLFGGTRGDSVIRDVTISAKNVTGETARMQAVGGYGTGILAGFHSGTIEGVATSGNVGDSTDFTIGGIVGRNAGLIYSSHSKSEVKGNGAAGGLAGENHHEGLISNSMNFGEVYGGNGIGGLVGWNWESGNVETSYVEGEVMGGEMVGGLIGYHSGSSWLSNSYANADVHGDRSVGGLIGIQSDSKLEKSYATGNVSGEDGIGGLVGSNWGSTVKNSYTIGNVSGDIAGSLIGENDDPEAPGAGYEGTIIDSLSLERENSDPIGFEGEGETLGRVTEAPEEDMQSIQLYKDDDFEDYEPLEEEWDISTIGESDSETWLIDENEEINEGYPFLNWEDIFELTINVEGEGSVEVNDEEVEDGWTGEFGLNENVELIARADEDWGFDGWSGDLLGEEPVETIEMSGEKEITANFYEPDVWYELEVFFEDEGVVEVIGEEVEDGWSGEFGEGELVNLEAVPDWGWELEEWSGDYHGSEDEIVVEMDEDKEVTAHFSEIEVVYEITDWEGLHNMRYDLEGDYTLTNDLDEDTEGYEEYVETENGWKPIGQWQGEGDEGFNGTFYGNGNKIEGLYIERPWEDQVGLFRVTGENAQIEDISLLDVDVIGDVDVGGLVGLNWRGDVIDCSVSGEVEGRKDVGGLMGVNYEGDVLSSHSEATVTGRNEVGGLISANLGTVENSYATGDVEGIEEIGGLLAANLGGLSKSYATGDVSGVEEVGGLVGINPEGEIEGTYYEGEILDSYAIGDVEGDWGVGGIAGLNFAEVNRTYAAGTVTGEDAVGGLVGANIVFEGAAGNVGNSFSDEETTTQDKAIGYEDDEAESYEVEALSTEEMIQKDTFVEAGWDFEEDWDIIEEETYSFLQWQEEDTYPYPPEPDHELTVNIEGDGIVEVNGEEVDDGWTGEYFDGTKVSVEAIPDENWEFDHWIGDYPDGESEEEEIEINMDEEKTITANFEEKPLEKYDLLFIIEDEDSKAISGATVGLNGMKEGTDENGEFLFKDLEPGNYEYEVTHDDFETEDGEVEIVDQDETVTVTMEETIMTYSLTFVIEDEDGDPIEDATVEVNGMEDNTDEDGEAVFKDLEPGTYDYEVDHDDFESTEDKVEIVDEDEVEEVALVGKVVEYYDLTFVIEDEDGDPIEDATVEVNGMEEITDEDGKAVFEDLELDTYSYKVTHDDYETEDDKVEIVDQDVTKTVPLEETIITYDLTFVIEDEDGDPIEDATVEVNGMEEITDEQGEAVFEDLEPGSYSYEVRKSDHEMKEGEVTVEDEDVPVEVTLEKLEEGQLKVEIIELDAEVEEGEEIVIEYRVENTGDTTIKEEIEIVIYRNENGEEEYMLLAPADRDDVVFEHSETYELEGGDYDVNEITAEIEEEGDYQVSVSGVEHDEALDIPDPDELRVTVVREDGIGMGTILGIVAVVVIILAVVGFFAVKGKGGSSDLQREEDMEEDMMFEESNESEGEEEIFEEEPEKDLDQELEEVDKEIEEIDKEIEEESFEEEQ